MSKIYFEDYSWYIKTQDNYGDIKYIEVTVDISQITDISEIFILMEPTITNSGYEIVDNENLYTLNDLPCEYWNTNNDPGCIPSINESDWNYDGIRDSDVSYFDSIIKSF
jgi:hypothetical protein